MDLSKFILTTDTDTLKNDGSASAGLTMAGSHAIAAADRWSMTATVNVGQAGSSVLGYFQNSKEGAKSYGIGLSNSLSRTGTVGGTPGFAYSLYVIMYRSGDTTVTFEAFVFNPYGSTLTTAAGSEVFTFLAKSIVEPF